MAIELAARQYAMMSPAQRVEVARQIAAACPGLEWDGAFVGLAKLPAFRRGGIDLVLVPGGSFTMGLGAEEMQALLRMPGLRPGSPGESTWRPIVERWAARARPVREVTVAPFLCGRAPLLDGQLAALAPELRLSREPFPEARSTGVLPAFVRAADAARLVARLGGRLLSEAEWEYIARGAGWPVPAPWAATDELHARPGFGPAFVPRVASARDDEDDEDGEYDEYDEESEYLSRDDGPLGVWGQGYGEWGADAWHDDYTGAPGDARAWAPGATPQTARGGGVLTFPWQDSCEQICGHPAYRYPGAPWGDTATVRLVLDLS